VAVNGNGRFCLRKRRATQRPEKKSRGANNAIKPAQTCGGGTIQSGGQTAPPETLLGRGGRRMAVLLSTWKKGGEKEHELRDPKLDGEGGSGMRFLKKKKTIEKRDVYRDWERS